MLHYFGKFYKPSVLVDCYQLFLEALKHNDNDRKKIMERALESQNERSVKPYLCRTPHLLHDFVGN